MNIYNKYYRGAEYDPPTEPPYDYMETPVYVFVHLPNDIRVKVAAWDDGSGIPERLRVEYAEDEEACTMVDLTPEQEQEALKLADKLESNAWDLDENYHE